MVELINAGFATAKAERMVAGRKSIEVARVRITEAGRCFRRDHWAASQIDKNVTVVESWFRTVGETV
jgi:hypothetical protein